MNTRVWLAICVTALVVVVVGIAYAMPLMRWGVAEYSCGRQIPGASGEYAVEWKVLPYPHWECRWSAGVKDQTVDLGWWPRG